MNGKRRLFSTFCSDKCLIIFYSSIHCHFILVKDQIQCYAYNLRSYSDILNFEDYYPLVKVKFCYNLQHCTYSTVLCWNSQLPFLWRAGQKSCLIYQWIFICYDCGSFLLTSVQIYKKRKRVKVRKKWIKPIINLQSHLLPDVPKLLHVL